jgi:hypothetical protein
MKLLELVNHSVFQATSLEKNLRVLVSLVHEIEITSHGSADVDDVEGADQSVV